LGLIIASAGAASAQQSAAIPKIELDEAVRRALENNPTVGQAKTSIETAEGQVAVARSLTRPNADASISLVTLDSARGFNGGVTQPRSQTAFGADLSVPVFAADRWARVNQARDQVDVAALSVTETRRQVAVSVAQAYLAVIAAHRQVEVDQRALESARAHLDYAAKRLEGGVGSRLNHLRAAQVVQGGEALLEATNLALRRAQEALGLAVAADGPLDSGAEPVFDTPEADVAEAIESRPDVQFQAAVRRAAERVVKDSWKDVWPQVTASFAPQYITPSGLFQPSRSWRFLVSFSQPLYQGGLQRAAHHIRQVAVDRATFGLTAVQLRARSEVRVADEAVRILSRAAANARQASETADEVLRITTTAFELGATTNIEVIDAQRSARDTATVAALADDAIRRARLDLLVALGRFPR
jgi:outer membrane protein TolC